MKTMRRKGEYQYTESGLNNVYLVGGFEFADQGKAVIIRDIDGLHRAIGHILVNQPRRLTGNEFRFLAVPIRLVVSGWSRQKF